MSNEEAWKKAEYIVHGIMKPLSPIDVKKARQIGRCYTLEDHLRWQGEQRDKLWRMVNTNTYEG